MTQHFSSDNNRILKFHVDSIFISGFLVSYDDVVWVGLLSYLILLLILDINN